MSQARGGARRQTQQQFYNLGEAGRKTGVILRDDGQRDENGLQPLDGLFSSPTKPDGSTPKPADRDMGEQDMEIDDESSPGPSTVMRNRRSGASVLPMARSPIHTSLGSPAIRDSRLSARLLRINAESPVTEVPSYGVNGKPKTVTRNLFGESAGASLPKPRAAVRQPSWTIEESSDEDDDDVLRPVAEQDIFDESMQMIEEFVPPSDGPVPMNQDDEEEREPTPPPAKTKKVGQLPNKRPEPSVIPPPKVSRARGGPGNRRPRDPSLEQDPTPPRSPTPMEENEDKDKDEDEDEESVRLPSPKKTKSSAAMAAAKKGEASKVKESVTRPSPSQAAIRKARAPAKARLSKKVTVSIQDDENIGDKSLMAVHRGPPAPKRRGLMTARADNTITQTRSGRVSYKPLQFWKGERVEAEEETLEDVTGKGAFVVQSIKNIHRVDDTEEPIRRKRRIVTVGRKTGSSKWKAAEPPEPEEPPEEWEAGSGIREGDVVLWTYEHEKNPPGPNEEVGIITEQLALAANAVETREIKDATFRYAKTMSLGFMGAGIVDLPPGSEKKPKNSRRMQLVFFVAYGKVKVTIHDNEFRIGTGGQFFVPRGNYYSISNDYDRPARIFFAQACEVEMREELEEEDSGSGR